MPDVWYIFTEEEGGKRRGPFTFSEMQAKARDGKLKPSDGVWQEGYQDFVRARSIAGLFPATATEPTPPAKRKGNRKVLVAVVVSLVILFAVWPTKWEYKTVSLLAKENWSDSTILSGGKYGPADIDTAEFLLALREAGNEGWELVSTFVEPETVHPNFGDRQYTTGIQPNVRTRRVVCVFKRTRSWLR